MQPAASQPATDAAPPRVADFGALQPWLLTLDEAVQMALQNSLVIRGNGGRVVAIPNSIRTTLDPAVMASDPNFGTAAALSAFDTQLEAGFFWNGGGRSVNSSFDSGQFGVFSQPTTLAKIGVGRYLGTGTRVSIGGVGGYDNALAGGLYAAYGADVRHPLLRGAGREFNDIAGPLAEPGIYRGVLIAGIGEQQARLELEQAVRDLIRDVSIVYWELYFTYRNLDTKHTALENARQSWRREQQRAAEHESSLDGEALARQQFYSAEAAVQDAIARTDGQPGVYHIEQQLRTLLGAPISDGRILRPVARPLEAEFLFDWYESVGVAQSRRVELRKQLASIEQRHMELTAARNLRRPQLDVVGKYQRLADDPPQESATFSEALQGWQIGLEYTRALGNRRENAAVHHAELRLSREKAVVREQERVIAGELKTAFTELDRAFGVMRSLSASRDAAQVRLHAQAQRHSAGDAHIERVLEAQNRATLAETQYQRSLVDYNLAIIKLHLARGTLLETLGVGFAGKSDDEVLFAYQSPSVFKANEAGSHHPRTASRGRRLPE